MPIKLLPFKKVRDDSQGFTLIEVLVAILIITLGILAMARLQITAIRGNGSANNLTEAATHAQERVETLMTVPYDDLANGTATSADGNYSIAWNITDGTPIPNNKAIQVTVTWPERARTRQVSMDYIKAITF